MFSSMKQPNRASCGFCLLVNWAIFKESAPASSGCYSSRLTWVLASLVLLEMGKRKWFE
jgi:hypothetical protein